MAQQPDIPLFKVFMAPPEELDAELLRVVHSGFVTQGPKVEQFEAELRDFFASPRVVTLNSATSGLHLALHLLRRPDPPGEGDWPGLQQNVDEVLTCPLTCTATNWPILANGLRIKWVDADPKTCNMSIDDLEAKLSPTTKVIMVVHWGGTPVDLAAIKRVQERCYAKYGFRPQVIEDCAHALGARFGEAPLGSHGNLCVFSLQAIKHLTSVDGGILIAPTESLYQRAKLVRWFGIDRQRRSGGGDFRMEPDIAEYGFKFHMNDVAATIGLANLQHVPAILHRCRSNAAFYDEALAGLPGISLLPVHRGGASPAYWLYTMRVAAPLRTAFISYMKERGIVVSAVHQRNDIHSCVAQYSQYLPALNTLAEEIICLPVGWWVTDADRARVAEAVREFAHAHAPVEVPLEVPAAQRPRCLITGGCGFIGHHVVEHFVRNTDYDIVILDKLSYASKGYDRLRDSGIFHLVQSYCVDLSNPIPPGLQYELGADRIEVILHLAAETHVDNSIDDPVPFVENNIKSTLHLLEYARKLPALKHLIYFSTDEVFGSADDGAAFKEGDAHNPSNPYSASKSAAEMICQSYHNTYALPIITMNVMNAFGERQHPEKFIPLCINKILKGDEITIHAHPGAQRSGSRFYIHARNIAASVLFVLTNGEIGEKYNVQGEKELDNLEVAQFIADELGMPLKFKMHDAPESRPGHDLRYALDGTRLREMGWELPLTFEQSLRKTIQWTRSNSAWLDTESFNKSVPYSAAAASSLSAGPSGGAAVRGGAMLARSKL